MVSALRVLGGSPSRLGGFIPVAVKLSDFAPPLAGACEPCMRRAARDDDQLRPRLHQDLDARYGARAGSSRPFMTALARTGICGTEHAQAAHDPGRAEREWRR